ncbi:MAG: proprotein convertase P-domain-containing protein [Ignavibacteria bacterium]|nr:proprotein convertase P-domain-containing protein [Ignavibacteria bacterium]
MNLRGTASFTFNSAPFVAGIPHSPVLNISSGQFQSGYYLNMPQKRIPATGTSGTIKDTIEILSSETISDLNIYIAINHMREENLRLTITSPLGATTELFANTSLLDSNKNLVTIFDSDIDSALISSRYVSFGPRIKPLFDIDAIFSGSNSKGKWILSVTDEASSDTGSLISWGVQINEKTKVNTSGSASVPFTKVQPETNYFLAIKHRNSIETWSSTVIKFTQFTKQTSYNFTDLVTKAFGNNMKQVDSSPVRFAVYSGDVDQDGTVDLSDGSLIDNDAFNFASGLSAY